MIDEDELIADCTELLGDLVADGSLELATRYGPTALATELAETLTEDTDTDLEEWLLDRDEVVELFVDADTLKARVRPILTRLEKGDGEPKWNETLAAAIIANPDDVQARLVFGDWLEQEGDPRGELVAVQAAIASSGIPSHDLPGDDPLKRRESSLLERFRTHFFGDLTRDERTTFFYGYWDAVTVDGHALDRLLSLHSARFLRKLNVPYSVVKASEALEKANPASLPLTITTVEIGAYGGQMSLEPGLLRIGDTLKTLPRLEHLYLRGEKVAILGLEYPHVKVIVIQAQESVEITGGIKLPSITELSIECPRFADLAAIRGILKEPPPHLTTLRLKRLSNMPEILRELVLSRLLPQLKELDLRRSGLGRADGPFLVENRSHFAHLDRLDLRGTYLRNDDDGALDKVCKDVAIGYDDAPDEDEDDDYSDDGEDEDDEDDEDGEEWEDPDLADVAIDEPAAEDDEVEEEVEEERLEEVGAVDRPAPVEEHERYDEPVE
jgi:uncharacterized protein (TIGR02996 family)